MGKQSCCIPVPAFAIGREWIFSKGQCLHGLARKAGQACLAKTNHSGGCGKSAREGHGPRTKIQSKKRRCDHCAFKPFFATQSAQDALESKIASAIIEQAATQIFMSNPKAQAREYIDGFGLTEHELELVRTIPDSAHCFLIKHGNDSVVARLNLTGEKELLTVLSGRERTVRLLDEIRLETGDDPVDWLPRLLEVA